MRVVRVHDDRINGNVRQIAALICPCKRPAIGSASYLEYVTGCCGRIRVEAAYAAYPTGKFAAAPLDRAQCPLPDEGQDRVVASNIHPVGLCLSSSAEIEPNPDIGIVCAGYCDTLILR